MGDESRARRKCGSGGLALKNEDHVTKSEPKLEEQDMGENGLSAFRLCPFFPNKAPTLLPSCVTVEQGCSLAAQRV